MYNSTGTQEAQFYSSTGIEKYIVRFYWDEGGKRAEARKNRNIHEFEHLTKEFRKSKK